MKVFAETDRFLLREIIESDYKDLFELDSDPEVHKYLGNNPQKDIKEAKKVIKHIRRQYEEFGIGRWAIIDKATNDFIGWTGLKYERDIRPNPYYDLGYRIKKKHWGKGIAQETALESLNYGFTKLKLPEICAAAHIDNSPSNAVLQKVGMQLIEQFQFEGNTVNWYTIQIADWLKKQS